MAEVVDPDLQRFVTEKVVLLQTRKRDDTWVDSPVNIAVAGDRAFFRTPGRASKNKRLRNFPEVRFRPCTWRGKPTGPLAQATARLLTGDESAAAGRLINRKCPVLQRLLVPFTHRLFGRRPCTKNSRLSGTSSHRRAACDALRRSSGCPAARTTYRWSRYPASPRRGVTSTRAAGGLSESFCPVARPGAWRSSTAASVLG